MESTGSQRFPFHLGLNYATEGYWLAKRRDFSANTINAPTRLYLGAKGLTIAPRPSDVQQECKSDDPCRDDVRQLGALERLGLPVGPGAVICLAEQELPLTATAQSVPVWAI